MKVVHINTSDISGGAARACYRLHHALLGAGVDSTMLVREQRADEEHIVCATGGKLAKKIAPRLSRLAVTRLLGVPGHLPFSINMLSAHSIRRELERLQPDIVHLHWINDSFVNLNDLASLPYPIVWTMHDTYPFTGGCHYFGSCERYQSDCANCPQIGRPSLKGAARYQLTKKRAAFEQLNLACVAPSNWLADCARRSSLFKDRTVLAIPNTIDLTAYSPADSKTARELLNLPSEPKIILFGAESATRDPRKGYDLLKEALGLLGKESSTENILLVVFGASRSHSASPLPFPVRYLGRLHDDVTLRLLYSAADLFICPSREDNLPNTIVEASACGTPAVGFNACGIPDLIIPGETGELATAYDTSSLATAIKRALDHSEQLGAGARRHALATFSESAVATKYLNLYRERLENVQ